MSKVEKGQWLEGTAQTAASENVDAKSAGTNPACLVVVATEADGSVCLDWDRHARSRALC